MFKLITENISKLAVIIIIGLAAICFIQHKKIQSLDDNIVRVNNNYLYYQELTDSLSDDNRTLQFNIQELKTAKDSLLQNAVELQEQLKIKDKNLDQVQVIKTEIKDTVEIFIEPDKINFTEELKLNPLTTIIISKQDSILRATLDLYNKQTLFIEDKKQYRNSYKNWFVRLLHFDFKKDKIRKYQIHNSNDLIKVTETRIVEIN